MLESPETKEPPQAVKSAADAWCEKVRNAKTFHAKAYARMRENMKFVSGCQWPGQTDASDDQIVTNLTLRMVNQKKATLYARNPQVESIRRDRLDFQLWDGSQEMLVDAIQNLLMDPTNMQASAIVADYEAGTQQRDLVKKVGKTLEILYTYNTDHQNPAFKGQMKDLIGRVLVCGAGFVRLNVVRNMEAPLGTSDDVKDSLVQRGLRAQRLVKKVLEEGMPDDSPEREELKTLVESFGFDVESSEVAERLVFSFPKTTAVIPDPACSNLRGFVGARWVAVERLLPVNEIVEFFELPAKTVTDAYTPYTVDGMVDATKQEAVSYGCVWEIFDSRTKTVLFVLDGYHDYLEAPAELRPAIHGFYPLFALAFNSSEVEPGLVSVFPLSDVDVLKHVQKEWNRVREALREHRKANLPKYVTTADLSDDDVDVLQKAGPHSVTRLTSLPANADVTKVIMPLGVKELNPALYDTSPLEQDMLYCVGLQDANMGQPSPKVTATGQTIAEQSRVTTASSNVDDLDDFFTVMAEAGGEMLLKSFSHETVQTVVGAGAVWPRTAESRNNFLHEIYLTIIAASSGRPNKALELANFERVAPLLIQSGANPQAVIREGVKRLDDQLDITEFYPLMPPALNVENPQEGEGQPEPSSPNPANVPGGPAPLNQ